MCEVVWLEFGDGSNKGTQYHNGGTIAEIYSTYK